VPNDEDILVHPEQPRFLLPAWLWAVMLFVFFGVIVAIAFGAMSRGSTFEDDRAKARAEKLKTAQEEWNKTAQSYGWVDKGKGVAHIPIQRAMMLEVSDLQAKEPKPAGPIATPAPAGSPEGAAQPANPPIPQPAASPSPSPSSIEGPKSEAHRQPAAAANPPNAASGTQPGPNATPAAAPKSHSQIGASPTPPKGGQR
jgi:hypothetical protein